MAMHESVELAQFGLTDREIQQALGKVKVRDVDYADLYFESDVSESVSMEEGIVKRAVKSVSQGVGVRATSGEKTGFAYSDELTSRDLEIAADTARYIATSPQGNEPVPVTHRPAPLALADQIVRLEPSDGASAEGAFDPALATAAVNPW